MNDDDLKQTIENAVEQIGGEMMTEAQLSGFMAESKAVIAKSQAELEADKNRRAITEKDGVHKEWYEQAKKIQGPSELTTFVAHLLNDYIHDYGTICHACAAAAIAGAWTEITTNGREVSPDFRRAQSCGNSFPTGITAATAQ
jgi:hypothetical protein